MADWLTLVEQSINQPYLPKVNAEREIIDKAVQMIVNDGLTSQELADFIDEKEAERYLREQREESRQEGQKALAISSARSMLADGLLPIATIAKYTQLSVEEIEALEDQGNGEEETI